MQPSVYMALYSNTLDKKANECTSSLKYNSRAKIPGNAFPDIL